VVGARGGSLFEETMATSAIFQIEIGSNRFPLVVGEG
jgi:hypothetical protein